MLPAESELLQQVAAGDRQCFRMLFQQYGRHIHGLALRFTKDTQQAEDLTQEVFTRIWVNRASLANVQNVKSFLNTIARNLIRDHLRKRTLVVRHEPELLHIVRDQAAGPQEKIDAKELQNVLDEAVEQLSPQLKTAFILSRVEV